MFSRSLPWPAPQAGSPGDDKQKEGDEGIAPHARAGIDEWDTDGQQGNARDDKGPFPSRPPRVFAPGIQFSVVMNDVPPHPGEEEARNQEVSVEEENCLKDIEVIAGYGGGERNEHDKKEEQEVDPDQPVIDVADSPDDAPVIDVADSPDDAVVGDPEGGDDEEGDDEDEELPPHAGKDPGQEHRGILFGNGGDREADHQQGHGKRKYPVAQGLGPWFLNTLRRRMVLGRHLSICS